MKTTIYYFSGTGNSLKVAKDIAANLEDTELIQICQNNMNIAKPTSKRVGIIFPVYAAGMPFLVKDFIKKIQIPKDTYIFTVVTFGGSAGASIALLSKLLSDKNLILSAAFKVKMPGNYQALYAPFSEKTQNKRFKNEEEKSKKIVNSLKKNDIIKFNGFPKNIIGNIYHKLFNPYKKDANFWTDEKCNGCGMCSKVCPANNITLDGNKPRWHNKCEQCMACMQWCPKISIQYKKVTINRGRYNHPDIKANELFN